MRPFRELRVWDRAHRLTLSVYEATADYPKSETYGLQSQTRRAATSIPTNIAEGASRRTRPDYARFLDTAIASTTELEYELLLGSDLDLLPNPSAVSLQQECGEIRAMLIALRRRVLTTEG